MATGLNAILRSIADERVLSVVDTSHEKLAAFSVRHAAWDSVALSEAGALVGTKRELPARTPAKDELRAIIGKRARFPETIGAHPDFSGLREGLSERHYITSVFVDMQGSTSLAARYPLEKVRMVKNGLLIAAIQIFQAFDGHIHRLQGDAVFAFFGRRDMPKADAVVDALNACMVLQNFAASVLSPEFTARGLEPLRIRMGVDFGDTDQVLWSHFGIDGCNEVTTTSIHTDLASKMQQRAKANCTMIGDNVRSLLDLPQEFYSVLTRKREGKLVEERYALETEQLRYAMWRFEWEKYLERFLVVERPRSCYAYTSPKHFGFRCFHRKSGQGDYSSEYRPNCGTLPIGHELRFQLDLPASIHWDHIEWRVQNRGSQATQNPPVDFPMAGYADKTYCYQCTAYVGHHYMRCTIKYQNRIVAQEHFGVFVRESEPHKG